MHVIRPPILIVQIVGMLPNIDGKQRLQMLRQWIVAISSFGNAQLRSIQDQPCPTGTELLDCGLGELALEFGQISKCVLDPLSQRRRYIATPLRREAMPVEIVVPYLSRVVKYGCIFS